MREGYIYLNVDDPRVAWGAYRGELLSAATSSSAALSLRAANLLQELGVTTLANEMIIERARQKINPAAVSRLRGLFVFPDLAGAKWATAWGSHFDHPLRVEARVQGQGLDVPLDANWITNAPLDSEGRLQVNQTQWLEDYWSGKPFPGRAPIWEIIVDGRAWICGKEVRERAYEVVKEIWPNSLALLELARLAVSLGSDLGHIAATIFDQGSRYKIDYLMDMLQAGDERFLGALQRHLHNQPDEVNWKDLHQHRDMGTFGNAPDLTLYSFSLDKFAAT